MISSTIINKLEANGWKFVRAKGDHWYYRKEGFRDRLVSLILKKTFRLEL